MGARARTRALHVGEVITNYDLQAPLARAHTHNLTEQCGLSNWVLNALVWRCCVLHAQTRTAVAHCGRFNDRALSPSHSLACETLTRRRALCEMCVSTTCADGYTIIRPQCAMGAFTGNGQVGVGDYAVQRLKRARVQLIHRHADQPADAVMRS